MNGDMDYSPVPAPSKASRPSPKSVKFELVSPESPQYRARLPMRVQIYPHDTTESIVTTVKNFYGLYSSPTSSKGVSFEDEKGNTLIARYENFRNNMVVYVRVIEETPPAPAPFNAPPYQPAPVSAQPFYNGDGFPAHPPQQYGPHISRPTSRTSRRRSPSPNGRGRRSASASTNPAAGRSVRSRSSKNRGSTNGDTHSDSLNGYSSGTDAPGSASGKSKEQIGNTEISVENIVEGGRRKRAKFESSELPLFAPPQMPAATSNPSVSPARRIEHQRASLPFIQPGQNPFTNPRALQSPQSYNNGFSGMGMYATPAADTRRARNSIGYPTGFGVGPSMGILPTPDPTVGSCMSEEDKDVAIQLMRLGEMSNISHGRTSASTLDDTFSGRADAASSTGATSDSESDSEDELPAPQRQRLDASGASRKIFPTTETQFAPPHSAGEFSDNDVDYDAVAEEGAMGAPNSKVPKVKSMLQNGSKPRPQSTGAKIKTNKPPKPIKSTSSNTVKKPNGIPSGPMSPASLPASRKPSVSSTGAFSTVPGEDDQPDLSTKPRCQRCRKSKKGCDRQRPCGRCKDAGIPAELCISEDEGNGRKGRYGRHMGVPIKKEEMPAPAALLPAAPIAIGAALVDKNKKRKR